MFTFAILYMYFYYQVLYILFLFFSIYLNVKDIQNFSLLNLLSIVKTYSSYSNPLFLLFLLLSGLPPVIFFLLKLVFLVNIFSSVSLIIQILLFINFLLSMLFYLQSFNATRNNVFNTPVLVKLLKANTFSNIIYGNKLGYSKLIYNYWVNYMIVIGVQIFSFFFFFDIFIIINSCIY